jgi:hypothetical protein
MVYTVSSETVGLAIGPMSETANDVLEALNKARQMYEDGLANVSIEDQAGHKIDGDELLSLFPCSGYSEKLLRNFCTALNKRSTVRPRA